MRRTRILTILFCVLLLGALATAGLAENVTVNVSIAAATEMTVTGDPVTITWNIPAFSVAQVTQVVAGTIRTNDKDGCEITANCTGLGGNNFNNADGELIAIDKLWVSGTVADVHMTTSGQRVWSRNTKTGRTAVPFSLTFKFNPDGDESAGDYDTTVVLTEAAL